MDAGAGLGVQDQLVPQELLLGVGQQGAGGQGRRPGKGPRVAGGPHVGLAAAIMDDERSGPVVGHRHRFHHEYNLAAFVLAGPGGIAEPVVGTQQLPHRAFGQSRSRRQGDENQEKDLSYRCHGPV